MRYNTKEDFLGSNNACGQTLLSLVSRGNAIICELQRMAEFIPADYKNPPRRYAPILVDFQYFKTQFAFERQIDDSNELRGADEELRENYMNILERLFLAFESVLAYIHQLNRFCEDLEGEEYIQESLDRVLSNADGKQLLAEGYYLYGVMLMMMEDLYEGATRERILVSYQRYRRVPVSDRVMKGIIGRLRSDDVYNSMTNFPDTEHRSTGLAPQAALLFVLLHFQPATLSGQATVMREVVDKFLPDQWTLNVYMGMTVNLIEAWEPYKAASAALASSTLQESNIKAIVGQQRDEVLRVTKEIRRLLREEALESGGEGEQRHLLSDRKQVFSLLRRANVCQRWFMLHVNHLPHGPESYHKKCAAVAELVRKESGLDKKILFNLLLSSSQLELKLKESMKELLANKPEKCNQLKNTVKNRLNELAVVFSGPQQTLVRVKKNEKLEKWFKGLAKEVDELPIDDGTKQKSTVRKLIEIMEALKQVESFQNLGTNLGLEQFMRETSNDLMLLLNLMELKEETLGRLQVISDLSYAWRAIDSFTSYMQDGIKRDPALATKLRATFLKLSSGLDTPLLRISQAESPDLISVSQFYSRQLVLYIRKVLQVIPATVFSLLQKIVTLQSSEIKELPGRLDKDKIRQYSMMDERYQMSELTHAISVLTEGVTSMKTTLVGVIRVDAKQLLEDGLRKELVTRLSAALHRQLLFSGHSSSGGQDKKHPESALVRGLDAVGQDMEAFRLSFTYISDYISLSGLKIWQEEFWRIINYYVERECNRYSKRKIQDYESIFQSKVIPIPIPPPSADGQSDNFVGRTLRQIFQQTDPNLTAYANGVMTWYDWKTKKERLNPQLFKTLSKAMGKVGLSGLDRLCSFMIADLLNGLPLATIRRWKDWSTSRSVLVKYNQPTKNLPSVVSKHPKDVAALLNTLAKIGQLQIIRLHLTRELSNAANFSSKLLTESIEVLNRAVLEELEKGDKTIAEDNPLLFELSAYLDATAQHNPLTKQYITCSNVEEWKSIEDCIWFALFNHLPKLLVRPGFGIMNRKISNDSPDIGAVLEGVGTVLTQLRGTAKKGKDGNDESVGAGVVNQSNSRVALALLNNSVRQREDTAPLSAILSALTPFNLTICQEMEKLLPLA